MAYIHVRTDGNLKNRVQKILKKMGLDMSTAINMYFASIDLTKEIPFDVRAHTSKQRKRKSIALDQYVGADLTHMFDPLDGKILAAFDNPKIFPEEKTKERPIGGLEGQINMTHFFDPLPEEVLRGFGYPVHHKQ